MPTNNKTITITYCDVAENHIGMQQYGLKSINGYTREDIYTSKINLEKVGCIIELINLAENMLNIDPVYILIIKNGVNTIFNKILECKNIAADKMFEEQDNLPTDKKALMRDRLTGLYSVKNKLARHNLIFGYRSQSPDYENGKGTIINFNDVPFTNILRDQLEKYVPNSNNFVAEGNYYYKQNTGITYHCDLERKKVIGIRLGDSMPLCFQWYYNNQKIGERIKFELNHGDIYILQEEALGKNGFNIPVLKHAAGAENYIN
jgi:hypothetical protein